MPDRLPPPGPSFLRAHELHVGDRTLHAGMSQPTAGPDDWWLGILWVTDAQGVVSFTEVAPVGGPPPDPPLARLGPAMAGALSGLIREEAGVSRSASRPSSRPTTRPVRGAARWRSARRSGSSRHALPRWAATSWPTRCSAPSAAPWKACEAVTGAAGGAFGHSRVESA